MQGHFWRQFLTQFSMPFHMVPSVLLSMVALITTYFKESDWLLKNLHQSESGWKSYHGEQNRGYYVKEHKKLSQKLVSKVTLHFVRGQLSRKQTVATLSLHVLITEVMNKFKIPYPRKTIFTKSFWCVCMGAGTVKFCFLECQFLAPWFGIRKKWIKLQSNHFNKRSNFIFLELLLSEFFT